MFKHEHIVNDLTQVMITFCHSHVTVWLPIEGKHDNVSESFQ
jgi:hypothetical protein